MHRKRIALCVLLLCLFSQTASAGIGHVRLYADENGTVCDFHEPAPPGLYSIYVVHSIPPGDGARNIWFSVPVAWQYLSFTTPYTYFGNFTGELAVGYGTCITTTTVIGSAQFLVVSTTPPCSPLYVLPPIGRNNVGGLDCAGHDTDTYGVGGVVNPDQYCCCDCIATEQSTWGSVKALYR